MLRIPRYKFREHLDHHIALLEYASGANLAVECRDCSTVIADTNHWEAVENPGHRIDYEILSPHVGHHIYLSDCAWQIWCDDCDETLVVAEDARANE